MNVPNVLNFAILDILVFLNTSYADPGSKSDFRRSFGLFHRWNAKKHIRLPKGFPLLAGKEWWELRPTRAIKTEEFVDWEVVHTSLLCLSCPVFKTRRPPLHLYLILVSVISICSKQASGDGKQGHECHSCHHVWNFQLEDLTSVILAEYWYDLSGSCCRGFRDAF